MANQNAGSNSTYSFKTSMTILPQNMPSPVQNRPKTPKEKLLTRDPAKKRAISLKNASVRMELSAFSKSADPQADKTQRTEMDNNYFNGKNEGEEVTATMEKSSSKSKKSFKKHQSVMVNKSVKARAGESRGEPSALLETSGFNFDVDDDEPVIKDFNYAKFLDRHYEFIEPGIHRINYTYAEVKTITTTAMERLKDEPTLIEVRAPLFVVGDIHGQFNDLLNIFIFLGRPPTKRYLFLGDYVDRGAMSLECILLLLTYKILYPNHVYLLRGNHECGRVNKKYGFMEELDTIFPGTPGQRIWALFQRVFNVLPVGGIIEKKILCMHGGLSPLLSTLDEVRNEKKPIRNPSKGIINDFLWSDPQADITFWRTSVRGSGFCFGEQVVDEICDRHGLDLVIRAHQVCMDGFWTFANRRLITVFSAPAYCNVFRNAASVLHVNENLRCQFAAFVPDGPKARDMVSRRQLLWEPDPQPSAQQQLSSNNSTTGSSNEAAAPNPAAGIKRPFPRPCT